MMEEWRLNRALWITILAGPVAWAVHLVAAYSLTRTACTDHLQWLLHLVSLAALPIPVAGGVSAARLWRRLPAGSTSSSSHGGDELQSRSRFMALSGMVMSAFFALAILAQWIPAWILGACAR
jgi:hypothetical protein